MYDVGMASKKAVHLDDLAEQLKVLGDVTRLELVRAVASTPDAEACVCDLTPATGLTQGTVSHHLKLLVNAGLMNRSQRGKWAFYSLTESGKNLTAVLGITPAKSAALKCNC